MVRRQVFLGRHDIQFGKALGFIALVWLGRMAALDAYVGPAHLLHALLRRGAAIAAGCLLPAALAQAWGLRAYARWARAACAAAPSSCTRPPLCLLASAGRAGPWARRRASHPAPRPRPPQAAALRGPRAAPGSAVPGGGRCQPGAGARARLLRGARRRRPRSSRAAAGPSVPHACRRRRPRRWPRASRRPAQALSPSADPWHALGRLFLVAHGFTLLAVPLAFSLAPLPSAAVQAVAVALAMRRLPRACGSDYLSMPTARASLNQCVGDG